jgi:hypothetical protein
MAGTIISPDNSIINPDNSIINLGITRTDKPVLELSE